MSNVLLTGYWPPTNEMLRRFSARPEQNPQGWIGGNWEGRGFDVHAHFPEFPEGYGPGTAQPWGVGELEVDYRKTWHDFTALLKRYQPVAVLTFSRGKPGSSWYPEPACRRWRLPGEEGPPEISEYRADGREPGFPVELPICAHPPGFACRSTLPMDAIVTSVASATAGRVRAFVPPLDETFDYGGNYLSGFIGLLGTDYQSRTPGCLAAGHIHVGRDTPLADAVLATEATLREVIAALEHRAVDFGASR